MRRVLLTSVAVSAVLAIGLAEAALAADMGPAPAAVYLKAPIAPWSWTGFYVGGNVGYSWGSSDTTVSFIDSTGVLLGSGANSFSLDGVIGGGQIGYNWQAGSWVWGLETDLQASGQSGSASFVCAAGCGSGPVTETLDQKLDWFGTLRGRLGFTVTPTVLLYGTGGLAYGDIQTDGVISDPTTFSISTIKAGWTVGAGVEARITGNWTAKLEYLYMDLGNVSDSVGTSIVPTACPVPKFNGNQYACPTTLNSSFASGIIDNIVRVGVNYKFQ
jgi:outer membrane immunogenic protein